MNLPPRHGATPAAAQANDILRSLADPIVVVGRQGELVHAADSLRSAWGVPRELCQPDQGRELVAFLDARITGGLPCKLWEWLFPNDDQLAVENASRYAEIVAWDGSVWLLQRHPFVRWGAAEGTILQCTPLSALASTRPANPHRTVSAKSNREFMPLVALASEQLRAVCLRYDRSGETTVFGAVRTVTGYDEPMFSTHRLQWGNLLEEEDRRHRAEILAQVREGNAGHRVLTYPIFAKDGDRHWLTEHIVAFPGEDDGAISIIQDTGEMVAMSQRLEEFGTFDQLLSHVAYTLVRAGDEGVLDDVLEALRMTTGVTHVHLAVHQPESTSQPAEFTFRARALGEVESETAPYFDTDTHAWFPEFTRWEQALSTGRAISGHVESLPPGERPFFAGRDVQSIAMVPVRAGSRWVGFLLVEDVKRRSWSKTTMDRLATFAALVAPALADIAGRTVHTKGEPGSEERLPSQDASSEAMAERTVRYASIGALIAAINHEMNQPLNALRMGVEGVLLWLEANSGLMPEFVHKNLTDMDAAVQRLARTMVSLRRYGEEAEDPVPDSLDVNEVVREALAMAERRLRNHGVRLELDLAEDSLVIHARRLHVEQMILHFVFSALATLDTITNHNKLLFVRTTRVSDGVAITVEDNGPRADLDDLHRLFDPSVPDTTQTVSAPGFGLPLVKILARRERARVTASPGGLGGTACTVLFPSDDSNA